MTIGGPARRASTDRRVLLCWAAIVVAAVVLIGGLHRTRGVVATLSSDRTVAASKLTSEMYECLEARLRSLVPAGATVFDASTSALYYQRIMEELSPDYIFTTTSADAQYEVTVVAGTECGRHGVRVSPGGRR